MWRCPHCGAPQAETARCWVCRRSSTTCSTCTHFRRSLAADVGWCALDRGRRPLTGLELRGCWEARPSAHEPPTVDVPAPPPAHRLRGGRARAATPDQPGPASDAAPRGFVPLELLGRLPEPKPDPEPMAAETAAPTVPPHALVDPDPEWAGRTGLFGEPEA